MTISNMLRSSNHLHVLIVARQSQRGMWSSMQRGIEQKQMP
jgi:hypothetical protein